MSCRQNLGGKIDITLILCCTTIDLKDFFTVLGIFGVAFVRALLLHCSVVVKHNSGSWTNFLIFFSKVSKLLLWGLGLRVTIRLVLGYH